jgi:DNA-binding CsgD family transcriptional regulator
MMSRERQILQFSAEDVATKEIARRLHISPKTAHANRHGLMEKLAVSSQADLTKYALSEGLTSIKFRIARDPSEKAAERKGRPVATIAPAPLHEGRVVGTLCHDPLQLREVGPFDGSVKFGV